VACLAVQTDGPPFHWANVVGTRPSGTPARIVTKRCVFNGSAVAAKRQTFAKLIYLSTYLFAKM